MNLVDKIMNYLSMYDEEIIDEEQEEREAAAKAQAAKEKKSKPLSFLKKKDPEPQAEEQAEPVEQRRGVLNFNKPGVSEEAPADKMGSRTLNMPVANKLVTVVLLEPVDFDDSQKIADYLRTNQPVVVNFTNTDNVVAKRMTDFLSGTVYAVNGSMKKLGRNILVCAPKNVDIDAGVPTAEERGNNPWEH